MKKTILAALVLLTGISAFAKSDLREGTLDRFKLDANYSLSAKDIKKGTVEVDLGNKVVTVALVRQVLCAPRMICSKIAYPPVIFSAELLSTKIGACNETIYTAMTDKSPVDGTRTSIQVTDNTKMTCLTLVAVPATDVKVTTDSGRTRESYSHAFEGPALTP